MYKSFCALVAGVTLLTAPALAEKVELKLDNGLNVIGNLSLAEGKTLAEDGAVLLVHGTLAHQDMSIIAAQRNLLNERELNVLSINLSLGLDKREGMYDCTVPHAHKHRDAIAEIAQWMDWLQGKGASSVVLAGHSRGGNQVAMYQAEKQDARIGKLVLIAPQTWSEEKETTSYQSRYKKDLAPILADMTQKVEDGKGDEQVAPTDFIYCAETSVTPASFVDYYAPDQAFNTPSLLDRINVPTLVVAGSNDTVVSDLPAQMDAISQDNVTFTVIDDADHMFIDFAGEDLADQVAEFVVGE
ncbi:alpha/beta hydrolase [Terasakiella pusilla]|uniref:alpha/beta hydrolase n=1 Tax=Terasakiella pusilla TaxID=64973 RepID=UPI003AA99D3C